MPLAQRHRLRLYRHRVAKCKISVLKVYKTWFARHDYCHMMHMLSADYAVTRCLSVRHTSLYLRNDTSQGQTVTTECQYELVRDLSNGGISNDIE